MKLKHLFARLVERPPLLFRLTVPGGVFRFSSHKKVVYLTFDDGPIPEATPLVLDILDSFGVKATFFMVGQNVERHPELLKEVKARGHAVGNHTHHHLNGNAVTTRRYLSDVLDADHLIGSNLFRPPHGWLRPRQAMALRKRFTLVMYDLVTRDYSRHVDADRVVENVMKLTRPGSVIVFHDSLKSLHLLEESLTRSLQWLQSQGYRCELIK